LKQKAEKDKKIIPNQKTAGKKKKHATTEDKGLMNVGKNKPDPGIHTGGKQQKRRSRGIKPIKAKWGRGKIGGTTNRSEGGSVGKGKSASIIERNPTSKPG